MAWMGILIFIVISFAGMAEIVPLLFQKQVIEPTEGLRPYTPLELAGRDVYIREGCFGCHSQMIRPLVAETARYGNYSVAGESVYDHPFQWGSKRTGPDLARVGGLYSDDWHRAHLIDPRSVVPESNMPGYPWLSENKIDTDLLTKKIAAMRALGIPYEAEVEKSIPALASKTEMDAMIAYLQMLGTLTRTSKQL